MKSLPTFYRPILLSMCILMIGCSKDLKEVEPEKLPEPDFAIAETKGVINEYDQLILSIKAKGTAGNTYPTAHGQLDGAPVIGYVFPTTLKSTDVGFSETAGIVAMSLTSHPDFDDTPLWDENNDQNFANDGRVWHAHWVVLVEDSRVEGGLSVKEFDPEDQSVHLPPTSPGMPMFMDSPGFTVVQKDGFLKVVIPLDRISNQRNFRFDGVTAFMKVNTSDSSLPMLGVYKVYDIASKNLSLPYHIR